MAFGDPHSSSPPVVSGTVTSLVTADFSVPAGSLVVAHVLYDTNASNGVNGREIQMSSRDVGTNATGVLPWALVRQIDPTHNGGAEGGVYVARAFCSTARTVRVGMEYVDGLPARGTAMRVVVIPGVDPTSPIGAVAHAKDTSGTFSLGVSSTRAASRTWGAVSDWQVNGPVTGATGVTVDTSLSFGNTGTRITGSVLRRSAVASSVGATQAIANASPTSTAWNVVAYEVLPEVKPVLLDSAVRTRAAGPVTVLGSPGTVAPDPATRERLAGPVAVMGETVFATVDLPRARVGVQLQGLPDERVTVYRQVRGQAPRPARPANPVTPIGGVAFFWDDEAPLGVPVTYSVNDQVSRPVTLDVHRSWLKAPSLPGLNTPVYLTKVPSMTRKRRQGVFEVAGRADPIVTSDVRSSRTGSVQLTTGTAAEAQALLRLLDQAHVVLLQRDDPTWGSVYLAVGDVSEQRASPKRGLHRTTWDLDVVEVACPPGGVAGALHSYQDAVDSGASYADRTASGRTYLDRLRGQ